MFCEEISSKPDMSRINSNDLPPLGADDTLKSLAKFFPTRGLGNPKSLLIQSCDEGHSDSLNQVPRKHGNIWVTLLVRVVPTNFMSTGGDSVWICDGSCLAYQRCYEKCQFRSYVYIYIL